MKVRVATLPDIPILVLFGRDFMQESPHYQRREYDASKAEQHYKELLKTGALFVVETATGDVVGGFAGGVGKDWFNNEKIAFDYVMYVKPDYRNTRAAYLLVDAFMSWAKIVGADRVQVGTTTGVKSRACTRLYQHFGLTEYGVVLDGVLEA